MWNNVRIEFEHSAVKKNSQRNWIFMTKTPIFILLQGFTVKKYIWPVTEQFLCWNFFLRSVSKLLMDCSIWYIKSPVPIFPYFLVILFICYFCFLSKKTWLFPPPIFFLALFSPVFLAIAIYAITIYWRKSNTNVDVCFLKSFLLK